MIFPKLNKFKKKIYNKIYKIHTISIVSNMLWMSGNKEGATIDSGWCVSRIVVSVNTGPSTNDEFALIAGCNASCGEVSKVIVSRR